MKEEEKVRTCRSMRDFVMEVCNLRGRKGREMLGVEGRMVLVGQRLSINA